MSIYTISRCLLDGLKEKKYFAVLFYFCDSNNKYKVSVDRTKRIIEAYKQCADADDSAIIASWLTYMTYEPAAFEEIPVDILDEDLDDMFLIVAAATKMHGALIVYSYQTSSIVRKCYNDKEGCILYNNVKVRVLDRDEAMDELCDAQKTMVVKNSVLNIGTGDMKNIKIITNEN